MKNRFLTVPLNRDGEKEYDQGIEESDNLKTYKLPEDEFKLLDSGGFFADLNNKFGLLIDDYESEVIPEKALNYAEFLLEQEKAPVFNAAVAEAKRNGTFVGLDF